MLVCNGFLTKADGRRVAFMLSESSIWCTDDANMSLYDTLNIQDYITEL